MVVVSYVRTTDQAARQQLTPSSSPLLYHRSQQPIPTNLGMHLVGTRHQASGIISRSRSRSRTRTYILYPLYSGYSILYTLLYIREVPRSKAGLSEAE